MELVTIQDVNDHSVTDRVSLSIFNRWPKSKKVAGARVRANGNRTMVVIDEEQAQAERVKSPIRIPEVVERTMAAKAEPAPEAHVDVVAEVAPDPVVAEVAAPKPAPAKSAKGKK